MGELLKQSIVKTRNALKQTLENITPEMLQSVPKGFNNNIHWQVGHILVAGDTFYLNGQGNLEVEKTFFHLVQNLKIGLEKFLR